MMSSFIFNLLIPIWFITNIHHVLLQGANAANGNTQLTQVLYKITVTQTSQDPTFERFSGLGSGNGFQPFLGLIQRSNIIVDKSRLLKEFFIPGVKFALITAPRNWGKSVNLNMFEFFASRVYDENYNMIEKTKTIAYQYFTSGKFTIMNDTESPKCYNYNEAPLISRDHAVMEEHLGTYVVVRLNFAPTCVVIPSTGELSFKTFLRSFSSVIRNAFYHSHKIVGILEHKIKVCQNPALKRQMRFDCDKYWKIYDMDKANIDEHEMVKSMVYLFGMINRHILNENEERLLFVFDEYDKPLNDLYFNSDNDVDSSEAKKIVSFLNSFYFTTFKNGSISKAVVTGIMRITGDGIFTTSNEFLLSSINNNPGRMHPYYGFTEEEVKKLLHLRNLDSFFSDVKKEYGYQTASSPSSPMFNPWDISSFLVSEIMQEYWLHTGSMEVILDSLLQSYQIRRIFTVFLNKELSFIIKETNTHFSSDMYKTVGRILKQASWRILTDSEIEQLLGMLLNAGYFTASGKPDEKQINIVLPNEEIIDFVQYRLEIRMMDKLICKNPRMWRNAATSFDNFLNNDDQEFIESLETDIKTVIESHNMTKDLLTELNSTNAKDWNIFGFTQLNEASLGNVIDKILSLLQITKKVNLGFQNTYSFSLPNFKKSIFAYNETRALIIQIKCNESFTIEEVLDQAKQYSTMLGDKVHQFDVVKFVAINFYASMKSKTKPKILLMTDMKEKDEMKDLIASYQNKAATKIELEIAKKSATQTPKAEQKNAKTTKQMKRFTTTVQPSTVDEMVVHEKINQNGEKLNELQQRIEDVLLSGKSLESARPVYLKIAGMRTYCYKVVVTLYGPHVYPPPIDKNLPAILKKKFSLEKIRKAINSVLFSTSQVLNFKPK